MNSLEEIGGFLSVSGVAGIVWCCMVRAITIYIESDSVLLLTYLGVVNEQIDIARRELFLYHVTVYTILRGMDSRTIP